MGLEWIITNGLGGYSSSTIVGINTRKYHGVMVAAFNPPVDRRVVLSKLDEQLLLDGTIYPLSANEFAHGIQPQDFNHPTSFSQAPFPTFTYGLDGVQLRKMIIMPHKKNAVIVAYQAFSPPDRQAGLRLTPLVNARHFHAVTNRDQLRWGFNQRPSPQGTALQTTNHESTLALSSDSGRYVADENWVEEILFRVDQSRGTDCLDDCYAPGRFEVALSAGEEQNFSIVAVAGPSEESIKKTSLSLQDELKDFAGFCQKEADRLAVVVKGVYERHPSITTEDWLRWLLWAADSFIVDRRSTNTKTVIAGYHWFEDWGRDALISLPGLALVTGRFSDARAILLTFKQYCNQGVVPNRFPDKAEDKPVYNTVDATLWYFNAVLQYLKYTGDFDFIRQNLWTMLQSVIDHHIQGTINDIHLDDDGLLVHGPQLTWMDAMIDNRPVTPRSGKAVEIQALWYNALKTMELLALRFGHEDLLEKYRQIAGEAKRNFAATFWNHEKDYLFDVVDFEGEDDSLRPNQVFAVSLDFSMLNGEKQAAIVSTLFEKLWAGYGLRTLATDDSRYRGKHVGSWADRDYAYHNGTIWAWLTGPFITAFLKTKAFNADWRRFALERFLSPLFNEQLTSAGIGTISEVFDGDPPHSPSGCISQAWSVAEPLRAYVEDVALFRPPFERRVLQASPVKTTNKGEGQ
jgi:predicted glycogen debranching enzyme